MTDNPRVEELLEELLDSNATPEEVCRECPELLPEVRSAWKRLRALKAEVGALFPESTSLHGAPREDVQHAEVAAELPQIPGYEVERVLGHGGMGVVYQAWHLQLNRPVALKMLLVGSYARPEELERFLREAESVAGLRHANIVQVYDVGNLDGLPYFTMEFVEGGSLAQRLAGTPLPAAQAAALVAIVAEAAHVAHQKGIIHRDLKPANILLTSDAAPKITDFGLARRLADGVALTLTGAALGTPSYMAPEQAQGRRDAIGPRTDVYALGAILYEMLTGRPPFRGETAAATVQQLLADEPVAPTRLNPLTPRDLETICLNCLHKEPQRRYASAAALADDLRRFERGEPIGARPTGRLERLTRWARRRPTAAALWGVLPLAALLALALVGGWLWVLGQRAAIIQAAEDEFQEATTLLQASDLIGARAALERAKGRLGTVGPAELQKRVDEAERTLQERVAQAERTKQLIARLEAIRLDRSVVTESGDFNRQQSDSDYEEVFRSEGLGTIGQDAKEVADRINDSPARLALVAALDDWALCSADTPRRRWLLHVARLADRDPWRDRVRDPETYGDTAKLIEFTRTAKIKVESVQLLVSLAERLRDARGDETDFLKLVQLEHPNDFFANYFLAAALGRNGQQGIAIGFFRMAIALRPDTRITNHNLGVVLLSQGRADEAIPYFDRAIQLDPAHAAFSEGELGNAWWLKGKRDEAIKHYREAIRLHPNLAPAHHNLGIALKEKGQFDEAIRSYKECLRIKPDFRDTHFNLGKLLWERGRHDEAIGYLRQAVVNNSKNADCRAVLGLSLKEQGQINEAIDQLRQAITLAPKNTPAQHGLRDALILQGKLEEARIAWQKALEAAPPEHAAWFGYAELCLFLGRDDDYRRSRRELLVRFGNTKDRAIAERTSRACLLLPGTKDEVEDASALADRAVVGGKEGREWSYPYFLFAKGLADYRLGKFDSAIKIMEGEPSKLKGPSSRLVLAMALHRTGKKDQAVKILSAAVASFDWSEAKADSHEAWIAHVLRREAEELILPNATAK